MRDSVASYSIWKVAFLLTSSPFPCPTVLGMFWANLFGFNFYEKYRLLNINYL